MSKRLLNIAFIWLRENRAEVKIQEFLAYDFSGPGGGVSAKKIVYH